MPIIKSAKKRVRVAAKANDRNKVTRLNLRNSMKAFLASISSGKGVSDAQVKVNSALDQAVKKGVIHKNKAARKKSQIAVAAKNSGAKPTVKATKVAAKPATKKTAPKAVSKKPATKKPAAKKSSTKK